MIIRIIGCVQECPASTLERKSISSANVWLLIFHLTKGENFLQNGSPEFRLLKFLESQPDQKASTAEVAAAFDSNSIKNGKKNGMKQKWFSISKTEMSLKEGVTSEQNVDVVVDYLTKIKDSEYFANDIFAKLSKDKKLKSALKNRKVHKTETLNYYECVPGANFGEQVIKRRADLTEEDLRNETWRDEKQFKAMNLFTKGDPAQSGGLHPLLKVRTEFRQILLEMGFEEMHTNQFLESSFWNFDTLFQPQMHPARDEQDTFFVSDPELYDLSSQGKYAERVCKMHEEGYTSSENQSIGWRYPFQRHEASRNILRTHTTAVSSRTLHALLKSLKGKSEAETQANLKAFKGKKFFSIDRVFRNETLDSTHLAEFHQVEGLIVGRKLGLAQLKSFIKEFFVKIGITDIRFKPAYNPYTEPSMEIFVYHPGLKKVIEIGNSGIFRPEMLVPMGWPEDTTVIAWGLSLERPAMLLFECSNIRELCGHKVDSTWVKDCSVINF